jgi:hypothetical protein
MKQVAAAAGQSRAARKVAAGEPAVNTATELGSDLALQCFRGASVVFLAAMSVWLVLLAHAPHTPVAMSC